MARDIQVIEPRPFPRTGLTLATVESAKVFANAGDLRWLGDVWESLQADDRLKSSLDVRADTLLGLPLRFEEGGERARKALEAQSDYWWICPEDRVRPFLYRAWGTNASPGELVWSVRNGRDVPQLNPLNPRNLRYDWDSRAWRLRVVKDRSTANTLGEDEVPFTPGDGRWVLYSPHGDIERPWTLGMCETLAIWIVAKLEGKRDWGFYNQRHGNATTVISEEPEQADSANRAPPPALTDAQVEKIVHAFRNIARNGVAYLPPGLKAALLEPQSRSFDCFREIINAANEGIVVTVLGQTLTTTVGPQGSLAAAGVHRDVAITKTQSDSESFSTFFHDQIGVHWADANWGNRDLAPWARYFVDIEGARRASKLQSMAQGLTQLLTTQNGQDGPVLTVDEARELLGYGPRKRTSQ